MAIDYTNLFEEDISAVISAIAEAEVFMSAAETTRLAIVDSFDTNGIEELTGDINDVYSQLQSSMNGYIQQLINLIDLRLQHRESVIEQLPGITSESSRDAIILALIADMEENSQTVLESTVTIGSVTESKTNSAAGTLLVTGVMSGNVGAVSGAIINRFSAGWTNQMSLDDTVTVLCSSSQQGSPTNASFDVVGLLPEQLDPFEQNQGGNRGRTSLSPNQGAYLDEFENFTADVPNDWTVVSGTAATNFEEETTNTLYGSESALSFLTGSAELTYDVFDQLVPGETCLVYFRAKKGTGATGTVTVNFKVAGVSVESVAVNVGSSVTDSAWSLHSMTFTVPDNIGEDDGTSVLSISSTTIATEAVYIDSLVWMPYTYFGGVGLAIVMGDEQFLVDDRFTFTLANDDAGKIQRLFTRAFLVQLPSAESASETIDESGISDGSMSA